MSARFQVNYHESVSSMAGITHWRTTDHRTLAVAVAALHKQARRKQTQFPGATLEVTSGQIAIMLDGAPVVTYFVAELVRGRYTQVEQLPAPAPAPPRKQKYTPLVGDVVTVNNRREAWGNGRGYSEHYGGDAWLEPGQEATITITGCPAVYAPVEYLPDGRKRYPYGRNPEYCKLEFTAPNGRKRDAHAYPADMTLVIRPAGPEVK